VIEHQRESPRNRGQGSWARDRGPDNGAGPIANRKSQIIIPPQGVIRPPQGR
jgi:hypothetical protein